MQKFIQSEKFKLFKARRGEHQILNLSKRALTDEQVAKNLMIYLPWFGN